ncbi:MAG: alkaline phosphatase family protein [Betaproteobacteria bacterium]
MQLLAVVLQGLLLLSAPLPARGTGVQPPPFKSTRSPVIIMSLDGLAYHVWTDDPAMSEMRTLRRIAAEGVHAEGVIQAFPSVTPAGHASLWTGTYGNISGVVTALNPVLPRSEHTFLERQSGFFSDQLKSEPLWVTAARQGVRVVAHEATQNYPFNARATGDLTSTQPVLVSGYGPGMLEPYGVIRPFKTHEENSSIWKPALRSSRPVKAFSWTVQHQKMYGALVAEHGEARGYTAMYVAADTAGKRVRVPLAATESAPPRGRTLARHYSKGLELQVGNINSVGYFRLFELARDGSDFMLLQTSMHGFALYTGKDDDADEQLKMMREAGGFISNGPGAQYQEGNLGKQLFAGGNGTAERRYLEGMELVTRQFNRHTAWMWKRYSPQLLVDYSPYPDEMEHNFFGMSRPGATGFDPGIAQKMMPLRKWGYATVDTRVALLNSLAGPRGHMIFVSDHGMAPVMKEVNINLALQQAGLLAVDATGHIDAAKSQAVHNKYGVIINTTDWRGGIVAPADRKAVVDKVEAALAEIRDPDSGELVVTAFYRPEIDDNERKLGIGGAAGSDIYFDLAPSYGVSEKASVQLVTKRRAPSGDHGFLSTREDMLATFTARGPKFARGKTIPKIHSIDVASVICQLLGIDPPAQSLGTSPFPALGRSTTPAVTTLR